MDAEFSLITVNKNAVRDAAADGDRRSAGVGPLEQAGRAGPLARTVSVALVLATVLTRALTRVFGELVPKNLAIARPLATARAVTVFQRAFSTVTGPLLTFFNGTANRIVRAVGIEPQEELASVRSPEELTVLVGHSARQGVLPEQTAELVQRSFAFGTRRAHDAMTPGTRMVTLEDPVEELVGEVIDEHDPDDGTHEHLPDESWRLDGALRPDEVSALLGHWIPEGSDYETLAGFLTLHLGSIATPGDRVEIDTEPAHGYPAARMTLWATENVSLMMAGAQLGITVCSLALGYVTKPMVVYALQGPFEAIGLSETAIDTVAYVIAYALVTYLHVVLGEMVPKNIALAGPERMALVLGPALVVVVRILQPVLWTMNAMGNGILRLFKVTPKNEVTTLPAGCTPEQIEKVAANGYSRFPVQSADGQLRGYVHVKDLLEELVGQIRDDSRVARQDGRAPDRVPHVGPWSCGPPAHGWPAGQLRAQAMNGLEGAGVVGDLLSWIGLCLGLPLLLIGMLRRSRERALVATEVVIVRGPHDPLARWFAGGEFYDRPLHATERVHYAGKDVCTGFVSPRNPSVMGFERHRQSTGACLALGITFTVIGVCGLSLSIIPLVIG